MLSQNHIDSQTPMGATLISGGGTTFRVWAPRATAVYLNGVFSGATLDQANATGLMQRSGNFWTGYLPTAGEGDFYRFWVVGQGSTGYKRDPYARELATDRPFPNSSCIIRSDTSYPWHDAAYVTPDYSNMIVYQIHIGTFNVTTLGVSSTFLDVIERIPYLQRLGINILQPLPIVEAHETLPSEGYDGVDYFSPDFPYVTTNAAALAAHLITINNLLAAKGQPALRAADISSGPNQLRALVDLCHLYGIGVVFDVVYNHAGSFMGDDLSLYFWDRFSNGDNNNSLYFTNMGWAGGLSFALWNDDVRQFLINNASFFLGSFHVDGFRYDEISVLLSLNLASGWSFCTDLTNTLRFLKPNMLQNAEYWPYEFSNFPKTTTDLVTAVASGGAGFDVLQHDALRTSVRQAISASSGGQSAAVSMTAIANALRASLPHAWQAVTCVENHDVVRVGNDQRIPTLADPSNHRSWYARSRSRVASTLLLTAPGIPQIFMGQEVLEDKQWDVNPQPYDMVWWAGVLTGLDSSMVNHLRFMQDLIRLRWLQPAIRSENVDAFHIHDLNRVLAFHRWIEGSGQDVIVVATLADSTWWSYDIGFPFPGRWVEAFNSDVYDNWVNPQVAGNGGQIFAGGPPMHGFSYSASVVIPANGVVVFTRS
jgi:1,4-alpha-glucan branching enzyme